MDAAKEIQTRNLKIKKNVIKINDMLLQISNVSHVNIEQEPKRELNLISIIVLLLGIGGLICQIDVMQIIGKFFILMSIVYFIWLDVANLDRKIYLYIYMNSGDSYFIYCEDEMFLNNVMDAIEYCINNHNSKEINIDLANCKLYNSPLVMENTNSAVVVGDNNSVTINDADWKMLQEELIKIYQKLPQSSEEYIASQKAYNCALNKDEQGLKAVLKEYAKSFASDLFSGVASGVLVNLLSRLM